MKRIFEVISCILIACAIAQGIALSAILRNLNFSSFNPFILLNIFVFLILFLSNLFAPILFLYRNSLALANVIAVLAGIETWIAVNSLLSYRLRGLTMERNPIGSFDFWVLPISAGFGIIVAFLLRAAAKRLFNSNVVE